MKPSLSFVLQLPPSTAYAKLDAVAENLLSGILMGLDSGKMNISLFMDGPTLETVCNVAGPQKINKLRNAIEDGSLELLGGGFYDLADLLASGLRQEHFTLAGSEPFLVYAKLAANRCDCYIHWNAVSTFVSGDSALLCSDTLSKVFLI